MNIYEKIKELAAAKHMSIAELERTLGFSNGLLYKWTKTSPSIDKVQMIADYFDVTTDYLLNRSKPQVSDPLSYYRIDTSGLDDAEIDSMKEQLDQYTAFLKSQLEKKHKK